MRSDLSRMPCGSRGGLTQDQLPSVRSETAFRSGSFSSRSLRRLIWFLFKPPTGLATPTHRPAEASRRSPRVCASSGALLHPPAGSKAYFREDHFSGGRPPYISRSWSLRRGSCLGSSRSFSRSRTSSACRVLSPRLSWASAAATSALAMARRYRAAGTSRARSRSSPAAICAITVSP